MSSRFLTAALVLLASTSVLAHTDKPSTPAAAAQPSTAAAAPAKPSTVRQEVLFWIRDAESKLLQLAEATPEAKYGWRPSKESRSTAEVFLHVAGANFGIPSFSGVTPPAGFNPETYDKSLTKKADVVKALKDSFAHAIGAFEKLPDAELEKPVTFFGNTTTVRGTYMMLLAHAHEHLGQSIAHARSNGIAPPWTAKMNEHRKAALDEFKKKSASAPKP